MKRIKFKIFGWYVCMSREPIKVRKIDPNRNRKRDDVKSMRLEMAENRCEICGKPIDKRCSLHHLLNAGEPNRNAVENVLVLCSACHHELEKRPHYHGIKHLESDPRYVTDQEPDYQYEKAKGVQADKAQVERG